MITVQTTAHTAYLDRPTGTGWLVLPEPEPEPGPPVAAPDERTAETSEHEEDREAILQGLVAEGWRICDEEQAIIGELPDGREVAMLCSHHLEVDDPSAEAFDAAERRFVELTGALLE